MAIYLKRVKKGNLFCEDENGNQCYYFTDICNPINKCYCNKPKKFSCDDKKVYIQIEKPEEKQ